MINNKFLFSGFAFYQLVSVKAPHLKNRNFVYTNAFRKYDKIIFNQSKCSKNKIVNSLQLYKYE